MGARQRIPEIEESAEGSPRAIRIRTLAAFERRWTFTCACTIRELRIERAGAECGKCGCPVVRRRLEEGGGECRSGS